MKSALRMFLSGAALAACSDSAPPPIMTGDEWSLVEQSRVSIGVVDGDEQYMFRRIIGAQIMSDGRILVAHTEPSLRIFDSTGKFVRQVGREGTGPGEFGRFFSPVAYRGDSIVIWDMLSRRVSVFGPAVSFARAASIVTAGRARTPGTIPSQSCCRLQHAFMNGDFILEYPASIPNLPGPSRFATVTLARFAPDGAEVGTVGVFGDGHYRYDALAPNKIRDLRLSGHFVYTVIGDTVFGGNGAGPWLLRAAPGSPIDTIRLPHAMMPVTPRVKDAYATMWRAEYKRRPQFFEGPPDDLFDGEYVPNLPAYTSVTHDDAGNLWLGQWRLPNSIEAQAFHVYSTAGQPVARLSIPPNARIADVRGDRVALIESDSLDVQYVRIYVLKRGRPE